MNEITNLTYCLEHFLFVRIHFGKCTNLCQVHVFAISESYNLIECKNQWKRLRYDFRFFNIFTVFRNLLHKQCNENMINNWQICMSAIMWDTQWHTTVNNTNTEITFSIIYSKFVTDALISLQTHTVSLKKYTRNAVRQSSYIQMECNRIRTAWMQINSEWNYHISS